MIPIELNLEKITRVAKRCETENLRFRIFLKGKNSKNIDRIVHELYQEISKVIDCRKCGNCCNSLRPDVSDEEIHNLSSMLNMPDNDFNKSYLENEGGTIYFKDSPCKFLEGKNCRIYENRPKTCRSYPHLHKPGFTSRLFFFLDQIEVCPIVFNLFEQLKNKLNFHHN